MRQVFDPNNLLWRIVARCVDFVGLGLFWLLLCIPVVTIVPATAALYYTTVKVFRQGENEGFQVMWRQFRANLKAGCAATLICIPFALIFAYFYSVMYQIRTVSTAGTVMFVAYWIALILPAGVLCWLIPVLARFEGGVKDRFRTAFQLAMRHLPTTFILVLLNMELVIWCVEKWWPVFFAPVLGAFLSSLFLEKIFPKYLTEEETAVLEGRDSEEE